MEKGPIKYWTRKKVLVKLLFVESGILGLLFDFQSEMIASHSLYAK